jgi:hypothetical protein
MRYAASFRGGRQIKLKRHKGTTLFDGAAAGQALAAQRLRQCRMNLLPDIL